MRRATVAGSRVAPDDGFSLLELIVSIGLLALILSAMPAAVRLGARALNVVQGVDRNFANNTALDFVEQHLSEALSIYDRGADGRLQIVFRGEAGLLAFVAPATLGPDGGLYRFELKAVKESSVDTPTELRTSADNGNGLSLQLSWNEFRPSRRDKTPIDRRDKRIMSGISEFSLRYYGLVNPQSEPEWINAWTSNERLPELIEIRTAVINASQSIVTTVRVPLRLRPAR